jgi:hypothetical protein
VQGDTIQSSNSLQDNTASASASTALVATNGDYAVALNEMWSSVAACNPMEGFPAAAAPGLYPGAMPGLAAAVANTIHLPSQAQAFEDDRNVVSSGTAIDGLVLAFVTSCDTDHVHCFDISVRCNSKNKQDSNGAGSDANASGAGGKPGKKSRDLEDLDGWRGYLAPMKKKQPPVPVTAMPNDPNAPPGTTTEGNPFSDADGGAASGGTTGQPKEGIVGIATCRASSGHKPIHMACITATNLVVCVDPHLYLSW